MKTQNKSKVPFLKWAGGKRKIIDKITSNLPSGNRLIEPFCGSATVFLNTNYKENLIADTNKDVINLYLHLQKEKEQFINYSQKFFTTENNDSEKYYELRDKFNKTKTKRLRAALFLYLNKHCFNGLCRYNSSGGYNVPFGKFKKVSYPDIHIREFIEKSQSAVFIIQDFEKTISETQKGDVIYCDPPYVPMNDSNSSFQYGKNGFSLEQQTKLADIAQKTAKRGIPVLISNHFTEFTKEIYKNAELTTFSVKRTISCKGDQRKEAPEVLALFS